MTAVVAAAASEAAARGRRHPQGHPVREGRVMGRRQFLLQHPMQLYSCALDWISLGDLLECFQLSRVQASLVLLDEHDT